jgi:hypothetical protein
MFTSNPSTIRLALKWPLWSLLTIFWSLCGLFLWPWFLLPALGYALATALSMGAFCLVAPRPTPIQRATGRR